jgi:hypothetical protein
MTQWSRRLYNPEITLCRRKNYIAEMKPSTVHHSTQSLHTEVYHCIDIEIEIEITFYRCKGGKSLYKSETGQFTNSW